MTPSPLLHSNVKAGLGVTSKDSRSWFNFNCAVLALRLLTCLWLYWCYQHYELLLQRPPETFIQVNAFLKAIMPVLPDPIVFGVIAGLAALLNLLQLVKRRTYILLQLAQSLCLLWLNVPQWSYGAISHVNHTFLLAHLFLVFIPSGSSRPDKYLNKSVSLFYTGILATYTLAAFWKVPSVLYKIFTASPDVHWLHPHGALYNAIISHRSIDAVFGMEKLYLSFPLFWQVSFVVMVSLQCISIFAAFRLPLRPWFGLLLVLFHTVNIIAFKIYFAVAIFTIICLFFPYDVLFLKKSDYQPEPTVNASGNGITNFKKRRERLWQKYSYLVGLLYLPGLNTLARLWEAIQRKRTH